MLYRVDYDNLSKKEELEMIIKSQAGDVNATTKLVETNIKLVWKIGRKARIIVADADSNADSTQDGIMGLLIAIEKFDTESGLRLSTYSSHWILQCMQRPKQRGDYSGCMSNPTHHASVCRILRHVIFHGTELTECNVWHEYMKEVERRDVVNFHGKDQVLASLIYLQSATFSGDMPSSDDEEGAYRDTIFDTLSTGTDNPEELLIKERQNRALEYALEDCKTLSDRDVRIIRMRFGFGVKEALTLEQCGTYFGISRERVRQLESIALKNIKRYLKFDSITKVNDLL